MKRRVSQFWAGLELGPKFEAAASSARTQPSSIYLSIPILAYAGGYFLIICPAFKDCAVQI